MDIELFGYPLLHVAGGVTAFIVTLCVIAGIIYALGWTKVWMGIKFLFKHWYMSIPVMLFMFWAPIWAFVPDAPYIRSDPPNIKNGEVVAWVNVRTGQVFNEESGDLDNNPDCTGEGIFKICKDRQTLESLERATTELLAEAAKTRARLRAEARGSKCPERVRGGWTCIEVTQASWSELGNIGASQCFSAHDGSKDTLNGVLAMYDVHPEHKTIWITGHVRKLWLEHGIPDTYEGISLHRVKAGNPKLRQQRYRYRSATAEPAVVYYKVWSKSATGGRCDILPPE